MLLGTVTLFAGNLFSIDPTPCIRSIPLMVLLSFLLRALGLRIEVSHFYYGGIVVSFKYLVHPLPNHLKQSRSLSSEVPPRGHVHAEYVYWFVAAGYSQHLYMYDVFVVLVLDFIRGQLAID